MLTTATYFQVSTPVRLHRQVQHSAGVSKFTTLGPLGYYTFLYRINTSGVKNRLLQADTVLGK